MMEKQNSNDVHKAPWHIYVAEVPHSEKGNVWVSFESKPDLERTKANIYGKCLPCIQHLYEQLKEGATDIDLGSAYHCWKVTAVLERMEQCLSLLCLYEEKFPEGHVYGKFGSGQPNSQTKVVVFHAENETVRDQVRARLQACLETMEGKGEVRISRACGVLYGEILGDWRVWKPVTRIRHPEKVETILHRIRKTLFWAVM